MTDALTTRELDAIAVFPLPRIVLFPATRLPLHIFELRYRRMLADCLEDGNRAIAMAQLIRGGNATARGLPPIQDIAGAGRIVEHRQRPDGTSEIVLAGVSRVRLHELDAGGLPYRRARAEVLRDRDPQTGVSRADLAALWSLASQIGRHIHRIDDSFVLHAESTDSPSTLADRIANQLVTDPDTRQQLLEALEVDRRVELMRAHLAHLHLALLATEDTRGVRTLH